MASSGHAWPSAATSVVGAVPVVALAALVKHSLRAERAGRGCMMSCCADCPPVCDNPGGTSQPMDRGACPTSRPPPASPPHLPFIRGAQLHGVVLQHGVLTPRARLVHGGAHLAGGRGQQAQRVRGRLRGMAVGEQEPPSKLHAGQLDQGRQGRQPWQHLAQQARSPCSSASPQTPAAPWT